MSSWGESLGAGLGTSTITRLRSSGPPRAFAEGWRSIPTAVLTQLPHYSSFSCFFQVCWFSILSGEASRGAVTALFSKRKSPSDNKHRHCLGGKGNFLITLCIFNTKSQTCCNHVPWEVSPLSKSLLCFSWSIICFTSAARGCVRGGS